MKPVYKIPFVFLIPVVILLYANSSGSPGGRTGSPGDNNATCVECHTGTANAISGWITSDIPEEGYTPGQTYQITATGTHSGVARFGFELTAENTSGDKVGAFTITDAARTKLVNANQAVTHTFNGITPTGNTNSWSMNWTAPATDIGQVRFYAAFNAANGDGGTGGDVIYVSNLFVNAAQPPVPALLSVVPDEAEQASSPVLLITGENTSWTGSNPAVSLQNVSNPDEVIQAGNVTVNNDTELSANIAIPHDASPGLWHLHVDDMMLESAFTVIEIIPVLLSVEPDMAAQGETVGLTIMGENTFWGGSSPEVFLAFSGSLPTSIEATSVEVISNTELLASFDFPEDGTVGLYDLNVDELVLPESFTLTVVDGLAISGLAALKMYPNPANARVWVELPEVAEVRISDLNGRLLLQTRLESGKNELLLDHLPGGMFIVEFISAGSRHTERLLLR